MTDARAGGPARLAEPPRRWMGITDLRRGAGLLLALLLLPALTAALVAVRGDLAMGSVLLLYLLAVVTVSVLGGIVAGLVAAVTSFLLANFFLTPPYHTFSVDGRDRIIALLVFLAVAVTVSVLVDVAARERAAVARSEAHASLLDRLAAEPLPDRSAESALGEVVSVFGLRSATLVERVGPAETVLAHVGTEPTGHTTITVPAGGTRVLLGEGPPMFAEDRQLLTRLAQADALAVDAGRLAREAERAHDLAEVDRLRSALLAAVGHDLRTPLAGIKAAATTLVQQDVDLPAEDRDELLATIVSSVDRLADLLADLLDLSRIEGGALGIVTQPVSVDEVVGRALIDRHLSGVDNAVRDDLPLVRTDGALLERVVANLVDNACRHSPPGSIVQVEAADIETALVLRVVDHGSGVDEAEWGRIFLPFQRLDDHDVSAGVGLGLAIARGFTDALGGTLEPSHTPGGGLTMTVTLPRERPPR